MKICWYFHMQYSQSNREFMFAFGFIFPGSSSAGAAGAAGVGRIGGGAGAVGGDVEGRVGGDVGGGGGNVGGGVGADVGGGGGDGGGGAGGGGGGGGGGGAGLRQPCGACKVSKVKCEANCPFLPYFDSGEEGMEKFHVIRRVFGRHTLKEFIKSIGNHEQRAIAVESMIGDARIRDQDPLYGCVGRITALVTPLQGRILQLETQLKISEERIKMLEDFIQQHTSNQSTGEAPQTAGPSTSESDDRTQNLIDQIGKQDKN